jgi:hypothetical protein
MLRPALRATALSVLLLAVIGAVPGFAISKEFNQSYPLQPGGTVELQNVNGTVEVQGWDRNEIEVHAVKTAKHKESDLSVFPSRLTPGPTPSLSPLAIRKTRVWRWQSITPSTFRTARASSTLAR